MTPLTDQMVLDMKPEDFNKALNLIVKHGAALEICITHTGHCNGANDICLTKASHSLIKELVDNGFILHLKDYGLTVSKY